MNNHVNSTRLLNPSIFKHLQVTSDSPQWNPPGSAPVASSSPQPYELASLGDGPAIATFSPFEK